MYAIQMIAMEIEWTLDEHTISQFTEETGRNRSKTNANHLYPFPLLKCMQKYVFPM